MLLIDSKNNTLKLQGDIREILGDMGMATLELVDTMVSRQISHKDWNETFEFVINVITQIVRRTHEDLLNGRIPEDVSVKGGYKQ